MRNQDQFKEFTRALAALDLNAGRPKATSHTSSVIDLPWQPAQEAAKNAPRAE